MTKAFLWVGTREVLTDPSVVDIYPNPVNTLANIKLDNDWAGSISVRVVNALGQEVHNTRVDKLDTSLLIILDMEPFPTGMYKVLLSNGEAVVVASVIRQ